ncbi:poly [ADP-ribose] polymerase 2-like [Liolophura sinensis]|uniref:poly [ADP-ribose] polymerase 2-like n=1 Tax=Liolophura sinensis TaxID=3198878 RepID=UPI0031599418
MPRRKAENGEEPSKKRPRVSSTEIQGSVVQFEWEGDGGIWTAFNEGHNGTLVTGYNSLKPGDEKQQVVLEVGSDVILLVKFKQMVQKNKKTGWERRIRCSVQDSDGDFYVWQWEDERGKWNSYDTACSCSLEDASRGGETEAAISACGRSYTVDLTNKEQVNDDTAVVRKVRRVKTDAKVEPVTRKSGGRKSSSRETATDENQTNGKKIKIEPDENGETTKSGSGKSKSDRKKSRHEMEMEGKEIVKTVVLTGKAPVDPECSLAGKARVFCEGKDVWDCMLNQTNICNNNNKYFLIQLLQEEGKKMFYVWLRWGRVGYAGQNNLVPCGSDIEKAKQIFSKKFQDKTKNSWDMRDCFEKVAGKYDMLKMDYKPKEGDKAGGDTLKREPSEKVPDSKLEAKLQDLIRLICDVSLMEEAVIEMKYDAKKAPLGKLTKDQIKAGYSALKKIDFCIQKGEIGRALEQACSEFYTRIPHDFGMRQPPLIRTKQCLKEKIQLLEALDDIEVAMRTLETGDMSINPVDRHYQSLHCDLSVMDKQSEDFQLIEQYLQNTHAKTHSQYKMKVIDVFECKKENEEKNFKDCGNRMLLWHGSRLTNWMGILSQGLKIAPPEAPVTGYMFGKGVYFADMSSKSANYCFASPAKNTGIVLLCEVSLGKCNELMAADYNAHKLPSGTHSVKGMGSIAPDPKGYHTMSDGVVVPMGKAKDTGVRNPNGYTLNYNEFIVYDTRQIKMRYLVETQFDFR